MAETLSATVLLRPARGGEVGDAATAASIGAALPDPAAVERATTHFARAGFHVSAAFGPSFSITGDTGLFERVFGVTLRRDEKGGMRTADGALELPLEGVPQDLAPSLQAVTFTPPPDFGPTGYA